MHEPIKGPSVWTADSILADTSWIHRFTSGDVDEIADALRAARAARSISSVTVGDFPLPRLRCVLERARVMLEDGPGLFLLRGLPTDRFSKEELRFIYWCFGKHLGTAVPQSADGDVLGDVRNIGLNRIYTSNARGGFHTDSSDVVGLLVLRAAKAGGLTLVASAAAVHNEIMRTRPDLLEVLYRPFCWSWMDTQPAGQPPYFKQPIFSSLNGKLSCCFIPALIRRAQSYSGVPPLTPLQTEAMRLIETTAEDERFHFAERFEPGDVQLLNNHVCVHGRTAFEDWDEPDHRRHLLRLWLSMPNSRALAADRAEYWDTTPGSVRAGFGRGRPPIFETTGEMQT